MNGCHLKPAHIKNTTELQGVKRTMGVKRLTAAVVREGKWYVARCLEVEVTSQGETLEDALANLKEALELYFEDAEEPVATETPIIAPLEVEVAL